MSQKELPALDTITHGEKIGTGLPDTKEQEQEQVNPLMLSAFTNTPIIISSSIFTLEKTENVKNLTPAELKNINKVDADGFTPLMIAVLSNDSLAVTALLTYQQLDINANGTQPETCFSKIFFCSRKPKDNTKAL